jgi:L-lactate utilization protein LutC
VIVVARESIVSSLLDSAPSLEDLGRRHLTWTLLTGPSRTADIERQLTIGVHGSIDFEIVIVP